MTNGTIEMERKEAEELFGLVSAGKELEELNLSVRSYNCLVKAGITSIFDVLIMDKDELQSIKGMTDQTVLEVEHKIKHYKRKHPEMDLDLFIGDDFD